MNTKVERFWFNDPSFDKSYPVKVFIVTILLVSVLYSLLLYSLLFGERADKYYTHFSIVLFILGIVYSLPTFILYYLAFIYFTRKHLSHVGIKLRLIIVIMVLLPFPFYIIDIQLHKIDEWQQL